MITVAPRYLLNNDDGGLIHLMMELIHNIANLHASDFFELRTNNVTRGHSLTIYKVKHKNNLEKYSFKNRVTNLWNKLPQHTANAPSINSFKSHLNKLPLSFYSDCLFIR